MRSMAQPTERFPEAPLNVRQLAVDPRGYPIPWFVADPSETGGKLDFTVVGYGKVRGAVKRSVCWICGKPLGRMKTFVIGPMCAVNRISSEPPSHLECATFAAKACPFLTRPMAKRSSKAAYEALAVPGMMIERNPGVTLVWGCLQYRRVHDGLAPRPGTDGMLFEIGAPARIDWFAHGRPATHEEVLESIRTGLPLLQATLEPDDVEGRQELRTRLRRALQLIPKAAK